mgnify:CR=1 FL=1
MTRLAFALIEGFADWEPALLAALARESFGAEIVHAAPGGRAVTSIGGLEARPAVALESLRVDDFDALIVVGSEGWQRPEVRAAVVPLVAAAEAAGRVVGGICGGTLVLAEAGLLGARPHTSNSLGFLQTHVAGYDGAATYVDRPSAVAGGRVVTAAGTAPATFAVEVSRLLWPERTAEIDGFAAMLAAEHRGGAAVG